MYCEHKEYSEHTTQMELCNKAETRSIVYKWICTNNTLRNSNSAVDPKNYSLYYSVFLKRSSSVFSVCK